MNKTNTTQLDTYSKLKFQFIQILLVLMAIALITPLLTFFSNLDSIWEIFRPIFLLSMGIFALFVGTFFYLRQHPESVSLVSNIVIAVIALFGFAIEPTLFLITWGIMLTFVASMFAPLYLLIPAMVMVVVRLLTLHNLPGITALEDTSVVSINMIVVIHVFLSIAVRYLNNAFRNSITVSTRTQDLLQAASEIGQITTKLLSAQDVFNRSVELIRDRFAYYHVQIFLVDEAREYANLVASTGSAGRELLARKHRLPVGSRSVIGRVTLSGEVVVARESDADRKTIHARNELLPNTRSELALPIFDGDVIIGSLDVQSTQFDAFNEAEIKTLQVMADQLGVAIRNARLFEEQERNIQENKRLFIESEANLREIQRLNQQLNREAWTDYLFEEAATQGISLDGNTINTEAEWTQAMRDAMLRHRPTKGEDGRTIAVPISLGDEVLGAIEVTLGDENFIQQDLMEMLQTISSRLAVSLDNARLFEESQLTTYQEQRINEVAGQFESAGNVTDLLQITLKELSQTLGAEHGAIRLSAPKIETQPERPAALNGKANGHHTNGFNNNGGTTL